MDVVFATLNAGKVQVVSALLAPVRVRLLGPRDVGIHQLPEETGQTFLDNAVLKAAALYRHSGLASVADDSGLEVAALGQAPGVRSARFSGHEHDDAANIRTLLQALRGVTDRSARFVCTVAFVFDPGRLQEAGTHAHPWLPEEAALWVFTGAVAGRIIDDPRGSNGFGYDPVFFRDDLGRTFAELAQDEKNALSHRGQAFRALRDRLAKLHGPG